MAEKLRHCIRRDILVMVLVSLPWLAILAYFVFFAEPATKERLKEIAAKAFDTQQSKIPGKK